MADVTYMQKVKCAMTENNTLPGLTLEVCNIPKLRKRLNLQMDLIRVYHLPLPYRPDL